MAESIAAARVGAGHVGHFLQHPSVLLIRAGPLELKVLDRVQ